MKKTTISQKKKNYFYNDFNFQRLLSHFGQISDTLLKHSLSWFTPTKLGLDWNYVCNNHSFTEASRFYEHIEEKVTQIISSRVSTRVRPISHGLKISDGYIFGHFFLEIFWQQCIQRKVKILQPLQKQFASNGLILSVFHRSNSCPAH